MKTFNEWLEDTHPEIIEEKWQDWAATGLVALGALANGGDAHGAEPKVRADLNDNRPVAAVSQDQGFHDEDVIERNGMVYIRGHFSPREDSPKGRLDAMRVAEVRIQQKAAKYFESKGGKPGFVPPGFKEITNKSDVLSGKVDRVVWAWKIPGA